MNVVKSFPIILNEYTYSENDEKLPKPTTDQLMKQPSMLRKREFMDMHSLTFHKGFLENHSISILDQCTFEVIAEQICSGSFEIAKMLLSIFMAAIFDLSPKASKQSFERKAWQALCLFLIDVINLSRYSATKSA